MRICYAPKYISRDLDYFYILTIKYSGEFTVHLNLSGNNLKSTGIVRIAQPLSVITNLTVLIFQSNRITEGAADAIVIAILSNPKLEELYLGSNSLTSGIIKIASGFSKLAFHQSK